MKKNKVSDRVFLFLIAALAIAFIKTLFEFDGYLAKRRVAGQPPPPFPVTEQGVINDPSQVARILSSCSNWNIRLNQHGVLNDLVITTAQGNQVIVPGQYDPWDTTPKGSLITHEILYGKGSLTIRTRQGSLTVPYEPPSKK